MNKYALACAFLASMTSILLGYDGAVISGASLFIKDDLKVTDTQIEILAGIINVSSLLGSVAAGRTSDRIGRRYTVILAAAIFFTGALSMGLAPNYAVLVLGRLVAGVGVGYALMIAPVYTAEVAPASSRGFLTSFPEVFINAGVLLGYVANFAFANLPENLNWRVMFLAGAVPPIFLIMGVLALPESPRWLVMQGRLDEAKHVLEKMSDSAEEAEARLTDIIEAGGSTSKRDRGEGVWRELLIHPAPHVRRVLIAAIGLQFFQQASGIDSVVLYSPRIFEKAGLRSERKLLLATVAVGFTKTASILVATFLLDRIGRRPLLLSSAGGMVVSFLGLATGLLFIEPTINWAVVVCIVTVLTFVGFFSIGLGPIAWVYSSEIFPTRLRAQGCSLGTATNRITSGVVTMTFFTLYKAISISGSFFLYATIAAAGWIFIYVFLPETKGRRLEEIEELFGKTVKEDVEMRKRGCEGDVEMKKRGCEGVNYPSTQ